MSDLIISSFDDSRRFKVKLQKMIKGGMVLYIYDPGRYMGFNEERRATLLY